MKCSIAEAGVYNLNRFRIMINDDSESNAHFVKEIKIPDDVLIHVIDDDDDEQSEGRQQQKDTNLLGDF